MADLQFRISSALKDIIGRDLITDDNIAIFELVKNSFDAYATKVEILFEGLKSEMPKIIIKDNGKGMSKEDLENRWLFVAYSAKRDGTEDNDYDYRDKIYQNRVFAGAKGIGRFSCDRLGAKLKLITTKQSPYPQTEILYTNWEEFEKDLQDEFIDVSVNHETSDEIHPIGTTLEISELRSKWDRNKLLSLKDSLSKLINPVKTDESNFEIVLSVPEEIENDKDVDDSRYRVNGPIRNFIFDDLGLKTTQIISEISKDTELVKTTLLDGNKLIYRISQKNRYPKLNGIKIILFYLNRSAKLTFARRMGLASRKFGNVFLYKNGFRIFPFGEPGEDPLKIDVRKSRKRYSRLGISELIGQIQINGNNPNLKETSSRGDGLIINQEYLSLVEYFHDDVLVKLENYVVKVQSWGLSLDDDIDEYDEHKLRYRIGELIAELTDSDDILEFEYADDFVESLKIAQSESARAVITNLKKIALKSEDENLIIEADKAEQKLTRLIKENKENEKLALKLSSDLSEKQSENLFLKSIKSTELEEVLNLMHHIGISTSTIQQYIKGILFRLEENIDISKDELKQVLSLLSSEINKIRSISRFATKARVKFNVKPEKIDLIEFIREYLTNIVKPFLNRRIEMNVLVDESDTFLMEFKPLELTILLDNLVSNSKKARATLIEIRIKRISRNVLRLSFIDNGIGITESQADKIFDYGYTTSEGSGMGLSYVKQILNEHNSDIIYNQENQMNTEFVIEFKRFTDG